MQDTNWQVITGAPCSGKTSVINKIEQRGIHVIHEVARSYIDQQMGKGLRLDQIKADVLHFERHILLEAYAQAGDNIIRVPGMPVEERTNLVLRGIK